ncbi:unnamed protein product [Linum tenue]|uniref:Uncharacterized protein n=1 Tax=Linum tenue TaxID=586396 RepID=A0AAV0LK55_9ROSI|nr:unnamed protein product [Linum tenue]
MKSSSLASILISTAVLSSSDNGSAFLAPREL